MLEEDSKIRQPNNKNENKKIIFTRCTGICLLSINITFVMVAHLYINDIKYSYLLHNM